MADLIQINNFQNKFSENLFSKDILLNSESIINFNANATSGVGFNSDYNFSKKGLALEINATQDAFNGFDITWDYQDALKHTVSWSGTYIFQFGALIISGFTPPNMIVDLEVELYINGLLSETFVKELSIADMTKERYYFFAQSFSLSTGDDIDFKFRLIRPSIGIPNPFMLLCIDGLQLNRDLTNNGFGLPTPYAYPKAIFDNNTSDGLVFVDSILDLPQQISNVITLADNTAYMFTKSLDLNGNRLVCGQNTTILGSSSEIVTLSSTGLVGLALINSSYSLPMRNITITASIAVNLDGDAVNTALDWFGVNFKNCPTIGTIKDYTNHVWTDCAFIEAGNLTYDGTIGSVAINSCLFNTASGQTAFIIPTTCTITRRFRANLSAFIISSGETGINFSSSATIPNEGYIISVCNFSGGGTYTTGVDYTDNKARFKENIGIPNSNEISQYYMNASATATVISATNTPVKVLGTTTNSSITQRFTNTNNRTTYIGSVTRVFEVRATLSFTSGNNNRIGCCLAKNGTVLNESKVYATTSGAGASENVTLQALISMGTNDYIEAFIENNTAITNITVTDLNLIAR